MIPSCSRPYKMVSEFHADVSSQVSTCMYEHYPLDGIFFIIICWNYKCYFTSNILDYPPFHLFIFWTPFELRFEWML